jgi:hypothetical protein
MITYITIFFTDSLINFASVRDDMDSEILPPVQIGEVLKSGDIVHVVVLIPTTIEDAENAEEIMVDVSERNEETGEARVEEKGGASEAPKKKKSMHFNFG